MTAPPGSTISQMWNASERAFAALDARARAVPLNAVERADRAAFWALLWLLKATGDDRAIMERLKALRASDPPEALPALPGEAAAGAPAAAGGAP